MWHPVFFRNLELVVRTGVGNLSRVAGQKLTLEAQAGCTNFPPTIPFALLFEMSVKLGNL